MLRQLKTDFDRPAQLAFFSLAFHLPNIFHPFTTSAFL
jgi:hypothetical protein